LAKQAPYFKNIRQLLLNKIKIEHANHVDKKVRNRLIVPAAADFSESNPLTLRRNSSQVDYKS